ncbi:hypothetical protein DFH06DRAFT_1131834 [Mycena polygramma]|nr:hypothetical protein DFH06DRAFT_1131834 [Mycena polygramma]
MAGEVLAGSLFRASYSGKDTWRVAAFEQIRTRKLNGWSLILRGTQRRREEEEEEGECSPAAVGIKNIRILNLRFFKESVVAYPAIPLDIRLDAVHRAVDSDVSHARLVDINPSHRVCVRLKERGVPKGMQKEIGDNWDGRVTETLNQNIERGPVESEVGSGGGGSAFGFGVAIGSGLAFGKTPQICQCPPSQRQGGRYRKRKNGSISINSTSSWGRGCNCCRGTICIEVVPLRFEISFRALANGRTEGRKQGESSVSSPRIAFPGFGFGFGFGF